MNSPGAQPPRPFMLRCGLWALLLLVAVGCASGPRYGAARRKKKGCDCPHWNRVDRPANGMHASLTRTADPDGPLQ
jgi:hypothetical protein